MRPLPGVEPSLRRFLREIESAQGPTVTLDGREVLLLCSNDYLGLAGDPRVAEAAAETARALGRRGRLIATGEWAHEHPP